MNSYGERIYINSSVRAMEYCKMELNTRQEEKADSQTDYMEEKRVFSVREWEGLDRPSPAIDATSRLTNPL